MGGYEWYYYRRSKPIPVSNGIRTKSNRGEIGQKWWSRRWIQTLESFNMGERLHRGRSYARRGQVISIAVRKGGVDARVQGSRPSPYAVKIELKVIEESEWEKVITGMSAQAIFAAKLLAGEMPNGIEDVFNASNISLFPGTQDDLSTECSCPDWSNPCKHIAAVYYILAERFDDDPFLIFKLRGRTKEEIIAALRKMRNETEAENTDGVSGIKEALPKTNEKIDFLRKNIDDFWRSRGELRSFAVKLEKRQGDGSVLLRLEAMPSGLREGGLKNALSIVYDVASKKALKKLMDPDGQLR